MLAQYKIVFQGETVAGKEPDDVKRSFSQRFNRDAEIVERIFAGQTTTLARNLDLDRAHKLANGLATLGAVAYVVEDPNAKEGDTENQRPATDPQPAPVVESADDLSPTAKVRHLGQIMHRVAPDSPENNTGGHAQRLRYRIDTFMAQGGTSIFKALTGAFIAALIVIGLLRGALVYFVPDIALEHANLGIFGNVYLTFLELTDPGNMVQDLGSSPWVKALAILAGLTGIVMLSALIAFITTTLDQKIHALKRGRSKVIESGHTLILGWNEQRIVEILRELIMANESEKDACVVILADKDKEEIDDTLRLRIKDRKTTRIVTRSGAVSTLANLDMVSIENCKSIIVLAECEDTAGVEKKVASDAKAIQTILATIGHGMEDGDFSVVVEIFNPTHREIVRESFPDHVVTVNTSDILAKLLVQTSRSVGLSVVYNEILSFDGCELYFFQSEWGGAEFGTLGYRFPDGVPIGVRTADGRLMLNPEPAYRMQNGDEVLIVADDDSTIEFLEQPVAQPREFPLVDRQGEQRVERQLMIGWNLKLPGIIREFADYIIEGSQIHVLVKAPTDEQRAEIHALNEEVGSIEVALIEKDHLNLDDLFSLRPFTYDNIIILANADNNDSFVDQGRVDSENIVALLLLRRIFSQFPDESRNTKLITEIMDSQNHALVARAGVQDVIISNRLISMIVAQIAESREIERVYDDLFQDDGSEIYLKSPALFFEELPVEVSFADAMAIAQKRGEICIGIKIKALENDNQKNNGVTLIPEKNSRFTLRAEDSLVVLAEDEL